ncbi:TPA: hypothetical protein OCE24_000197 [Escherichia coli]|uniref:hypothetical protein n=1 Tax=Escherichia coli TaxID=562 RepID=UPI000BDEB84D|nr:hypothetical protein [Escherichia coli]EFH3041242.1 hypothetical protein [Escherichia coli]EIY1871573.1 hypothetical protein [Escherichia coli]MBZ8881416.1 hypothetical protein [Escherichia coli]MBZ9122473.1 hypothetical protein [Escherichia coli]MBZ9132030.1 hypothetical protein [Escherichia coli]
MEVFLIIVGIVIINFVFLFIAKKQKSNNIHASTTDALIFVEHALNVSGYKLTPYGASVSLLSLSNGFSKEETFSHIALMALSQHAKVAGSDVIELSKVSIRAMSIAESLTKLFRKGLIRSEIYKNDLNAIMAVSTINKNQEDWISIVLESNSTSNKDAIALPISAEDSLEAINSH